MYAGSIFVGDKQVPNDVWQEARAPTATGLDPSTTQRNGTTPPTKMYVCLVKKSAQDVSAREKSKIRKIKGPLRNINE